MSSRHYRKQSYERLSKSPFWRLFKVIYGVLSLVSLIAAYNGGWHAVCPQNGSAQPLGFLPPVTCNTGEAFGNAIVMTILVAVGLVALFWIIRLAAIYVIYGNLGHETSQKADIV